MSSDRHQSDRSGLPRRPAARVLCVAIAVCALACALPITAGADEPGPPGVGGGAAHNLSIGIYWGLYEERESHVQDNIAIVGAPMPFEMQLLDNGEDRLFIFIQHRLPAGPYCAETPAQLEHVSVALTAGAGDPTVAGPAYRQTYLWTPTEPGEYALCATLRGGKHRLLGPGTAAEPRTGASAAAASAAAAGAQQREDDQQPLSCCEERGP